MLWEIGVIVCSIAFLLLVLFAIPSLIQLRKTTRSLEITSKTLNQNLPGILTNLDEITTNLTNTTRSVHEQMEGISQVVEKVQEIADDVVTFERNIRTEIESPIIETVATVTGVLKGVSAFLSVLRTK